MTFIDLKIGSKKLKDKVSSTKISLYKNLLSLDDLEALSTLLVTDMSLNDAFFIIKTKRNESLLEAIKMRLDRGELIEVVLKDHLVKEIKVTFSALINHLSLAKTLELTLALYRKTKVLKDKVQKDLTYPLLLLCFSIVGIYLFNGYCFEPLLLSMSEFSGDVSSLYIFKNVLDLLITIIFLILLLGLSLFLYFFRPKRIVLAYVLLEKYLPTSIIKEYLTSRFVIFYRECYAIGLKTKETIDAMRKMHDEPLIAFIASNIDKTLLEGEEMEKALTIPYLDDKIARFIKIGQHSGALEIMLDGYMVQFYKRFSKWCNDLAKVTQVVSYLMIGLVIIFVYQILFIPMGVLGGQL